MKSAPSGWLCLGLFFASATASAALNERQEARYLGWINQLRCLVCQNQSIADSGAPLAADLREQVRGQIEAGRSDEEIRHYVTARYGDFVLYDPPLKRSTWMLWLAPFLLLILGLVFLARRLKTGGEPS